MEVPINIPLFILAIEAVLPLPGALQGLDRDVQCMSWVYPQSKSLAPWGLSPSLVSLALIQVFSLPALPYKMLTIRCCAEQGGREKVYARAFLS